jgi:nickel/cobalt transporter (NicO) family protein
MRAAPRWATTGLLVTVAWILLAAPAAAHPLDEVVHQTYLTPAASRLTVRLDLTPGVLVAAQFARSVDVNGDGALTAAEIDGHVVAVQSAVSAEVDGRVVDLTVVDRRYPPVDLLAAGGGTVTLEWSAALPGDARQVVFSDRYDPGATSAVQMSVLVASDPVPLGRIGHEDNGRRMTVALNPDAPSSAAAHSAALGAPAGSTMLDALRSPLTSPWALLALVGACSLLGALHALTPGHGKALLAAYLLSDRGTPTDAVTLGVVITASHTAAVLAIGAAVLAAGEYIVPGVVVPVLTTAAGAIVLVLGIRMVRRRWVGATALAAHAHTGTGHGHGTAVAAPARLRSVAAMGLSAGMIPCPEALSVLLLAIGLNRTALGMVMIVAFSVGLAAVLVGLGLLLVTGSPLLSRFDGRSGWFTQRVPLVSALVVAVRVGVMAMTGLSGLAG